MYSAEEILYEATSGLAINFVKSGIMFSSNTSGTIQDLVKSMLGINSPIDHGRYLELLSLNKLLSWVGKKVLIKNVAQCVPVYNMSMFLLPMPSCAKLHRMLNLFWWGSSWNCRKGVHWATSDHLCVPMKWGGMGFIDFHGLTLALLGKQVVRLVSNPNSLVSRFLKAKYFSSCSLFETDDVTN
ncbi:hypothetical protein GOBAR_DD29369 [Gossypium barbadense]|nr:hypothetical protein GOBAR_DD29369 [Gossypium barbadense]